MQLDTISFALNINPDLPPERQLWGIRVLINQVDMSLIETYDRYSILNVGSLPEERDSWNAPGGDNERTIRGSFCVEDCCPSLRVQVELGPLQVRWSNPHNWNRDSITEVDDLEAGWRQDYVFDRAQYLQAVIAVLRELDAFNRGILSPDAAKVCDPIIAELISSAERALVITP